MRTSSNYSWWGVGWQVGLRWRYGVYVYACQEGGAMGVMCMPTNRARI